MQAAACRATPRRESASPACGSGPSNLGVGWILVQTLVQPREGRRSGRLSRFRGRPERAANDSRVPTSTLRPGSDFVRACAGGGKTVRCPVVLFLSGCDGERTLRRQRAEPFIHWAFRLGLLLFLSAAATLPRSGFLLATHRLPGSDIVDSLVDRVQAARRRSWPRNQCPVPNDRRHGARRDYLDRRERPDFPGESGRYQNLWLGCTGNDRPAAYHPPADLPAWGAPVRR